MKKFFLYDDHYKSTSRHLCLKKKNKIKISTTKRFKFFMETQYYLYELVKMKSKTFFLERDDLKKKKNLRCE